MKPKIKALLFGQPRECSAAGEILHRMEALSDYHQEHCHTNDMEEFETLLVNWMPSLMIVLADGAAGMESVYRSWQRRPALPVFWFSDDRDFGMQSYRLNCAYFSTKPITEEKLLHAVRRCHRIGIDYAAR